MADPWYGLRLLGRKVWEGQLTTTTERRAYTVRELARAWGRSERTIYDHIKAGKIRAFKIGGGLAITVAEVERIEGKREREGTDA